VLVSEADPARHRASLPSRAEIAEMRAMLGPRSSFLSIAVRDFATAQRRSHYPSLMRATVVCVRAEGLNAPSFLHSFNVATSNKLACPSNILRARALSGASTL
jgi:hypothetical protein